MTFDCIAPVLAALGLSENDPSDVGPFLVAFEQLLDQAAVAEAAVIHHMGHGAERSRGASRLRDWPDAEWKIVYERPKDGDAEPGPAAGRYFEAVGRDVAEPEQRLDFDPATRRLSAGGGSRQAERAAGMLAAITAYIEGHGEDECSQTRIESGVDGRAQDIRQVLDRAVQDGSPPAPPRAVQAAPDPREVRRPQPGRVRRAGAVRPRYPVHPVQPRPARSDGVGANPVPRPKPQLRPHVRDHFRRRVLR